MHIFIRALTKDGPLPDAIMDEHGDLRWSKEEGSARGTFSIAVELTDEWLNFEQYGALYRLLYVAVNPTVTFDGFSR